MNTSNPSVFFAYAGQPQLVAETMRDTVQKLRNQGINACHWEDIQNDGRIIIDEILAKIDKCDFCVAEIGSLNCNVLFEAGYAVGKGKKVIFAVEDSDLDALDRVGKLKYFDTIGQTRYSGSASALANQVASIAFASTQGSPLIGEWLSNARTRETNVVFAPQVPYSFAGPERLQSELERMSHLKIAALSDDLSRASIEYYVREVYRSSATVFHLLTTNRRDHLEHNARASFLAGIAKAFDIPTLLVAEKDYESALDYRNLFYGYSKASELQGFVTSWLDKLSLETRNNKRLGRLNLATELPLRDFGDYVAENEHRTLADYFVPTSEFEEVIKGHAKFFVGRKGTGKSATMLQTERTLAKDLRNLVVPVQPSSYDLGALLDLLNMFEDSLDREYYLKALWEYLLQCEIASQVLTDSLEKANGRGVDHTLESLKETMDMLKIEIDSDMSSRIDTVVELASESEDLNEAARRLRQAWSGRNEERLRKATSRFDRVAILVDNLDKTWEKGANFEALSHFLLALLSGATNLEKNLSKRKNGLPPVTVTLAIFLRTDIYSAMCEFAREPDKINAKSIKWKDEHLLIRVLEHRYLAKRNDENASPSGLWEEIFTDECRGLVAKDYLLWRSLPRPRDLIYLANSALSTAINRQHDRVLAQDLEFGEKDYSEFALQALLVESAPKSFNLEDILFEFPGKHATLTETELKETIGNDSNFEEVRAWLIQTSFLGIETSRGEFYYAEGETEARKKLKLAERLHSETGSEIHFRVHPAFRPTLEITDDET